MNSEPILQVVFFRTPSGRESVRDWLREMEKDDRKVIGEDIKLVQFRCPSVCHSCANLKPICGKCGRASAVAASHGSCLRYMRQKWRYCTDS